MSEAVDPLGNAVHYTYDDLGQIDTITQKNAAGDTLRTVDLEYDANGNLVSVLPPGRPEHELEPNEVDLLQAYYAPTVGLVTPTTHYEYNRDQQLELITRPDGSEVDPVYDATTGQLLEVLFPTGQLEYTYDPTARPGRGR